MKPVILSINILNVEVIFLVTANICFSDKTGPSSIFVSILN